MSGKNTSSLPDSLLSKLKTMAERLREVDQLLSSPEVVSDGARVRSLAKERGTLVRPAELYSKWSQVAGQLKETREVAEDPEGDSELRELAMSELPELEEEQSRLAEEIQETLLLEEPDQERDVIVEIRAGTGGEEAALFAADLFRMYTTYAEEKGWKVELMGSHKTNLGGFKEVAFSVQGENVYRLLSLESGGHRVQRVPVTEAGGRIHTSAATVAVLPEVEEVEVQINEEDLKIDTFGSSGPGGQHVNKTASAVRITHIPSGMVVSCQDEKSQHRNRERALRVLRSRLYEFERREHDNAVAKERREQIGSGDRSQRIRTYNWPQNRITDHRAGVTLYKLDQVIAGNLDLLIEPLLEWDKQEKLKAL